MTAINPTTTRRSLKKKQTFWKHVTVFAIVNAAFWLSWIIGGVTDAWLAPWPLLPTIVWGLFILAYEYQLGGPEAISHETMADEADLLRHPDRDLYNRPVERRTITFGDFRAYTPVPEFKWREVIDARDTAPADTAGPDNPSPDKTATGGPGLPRG